MDQSQAAGAIRQRLSQRMQHAPRLHKAASVKNAGPAGLNQLKMLVTENINVPSPEILCSAPR